MLSLLRWGLGSSHDPLTEKARIQEEERCRPQAMQTMNPGTVKRKRGKSNQFAQSQQRPSKRSPQYLSHIEVPSSRNGSLSQSRTNSIDSLVKNGDLPATAVMSPSEAMDLDDVAVTDGAEEGGPRAPTHQTTKNGRTASVNATDRIAKLRQVIETEFDLEILLKHNELRLIDQEIAKCQVALEQLRRCSVIPYPATTSNLQDMLNVSSGTGIPQPSVPGIPPADQPPPWGVVDGPYSRHYSQWLLPDRTFDGGFAEEVRQPAKAGKTLPERSTRGGKAEKSLTTPKARTHRGVAQTRFQALPAGYPEPKEDKGPMILKRASDGKLVKLVCPNCHRENFNSAQGFINHCRIAHSHNLASHEVAARECGQEVDPNEVFVPPPDSAVPQSAHPYNPTANLVHPLIRGGMVPQVPTLSIPTPKPKKNAKPTAPTNTTPFKPSPQTPHLSKLLAKLIPTTDLPSALEDATKKEDLILFSEPETSSQPASDSDFEMEDAPPLSPAVTAAMARVPSRTISTRGGPANTSSAPAPSSSGRPKSRKGLRPGSSYTTQPQPQPQLLSSARPRGAGLPSVTPPTLSPHTLESNAPEPSLVSDHDPEDDSYSARHASTSSASPSSSEEEAEGEELDVDVDGDVGMEVEVEVEAEAEREEVAEGKVGGRSADVDPELRASEKARTRTPVGRRARRRGRGMEGEVEKVEEREVVAAVDEEETGEKDEEEVVEEVVEEVQIRGGRRTRARAAAGATGGNAGGGRRRRK